MTLLNVPYDPKIKAIIALSYRTYNRVFRVDINHLAVKNFYLLKVINGYLESLYKENDWKHDVAIS